MTPFGNIYMEWSHVKYLFISTQIYVYFFIVLRRFFCDLFVVVSHIGLSDPRNITGFLKRKNNWLFPFFTSGIPLGPGAASELNECKFINSE